MSQYAKSIGSYGESIVCDEYLKHGFSLVKKNFTMRGGEIDLIFRRGGLLVFVEVKVMNYLSDIHGYVTKKKLRSVAKTMKYFLLLASSSSFTDCDLRLDVAFVKNNSLYEIFENVAL